MLSADGRLSSRRLPRDAPGDDLLRPPRSPDASQVSRRGGRALRHPLPRLLPDDEPPSPALGSSCARPRPRHAPRQRRLCPLHQPQARAPRSRLRRTVRRGARRGRRPPVEVCRYIVRNPVRAGLVKHPGDWPWSSYRATAALERAPSFLRVDTIRGLFGSPAAYREFCNQVAEQPGCKEPAYDVQPVSNPNRAGSV